MHLINDEGSGQAGQFFEQGFGSAGAGKRAAAE